MLTELRVKGFKSLHDVRMTLPRLSVLFGPNTAGKSNLIDAIQAISRIATKRTLADALGEPIRGYPIEASSFPPAGLPGLLEAEMPTFTLGAQLRAGGERFDYEITIGIQPASGALSVRRECLASLTRTGEVKGGPRIETTADGILVRARAHPGRPRQEPIGLNYAILSDARLGGTEHKVIETCRNEFAGWRTYYLDPRSAMRAARAPLEVDDISVLGENIAPFLYRLKAEFPRHFASLNRTLRLLVPSLDEVEVDLDRRRGTLDILVRQEGMEFSSRIISEGTLRLLALCAVAMNPWSGSLVAFEEPENGVHPLRIELIADLISSMAERSVQVIVTTHSPLFCDAILRRARERLQDVVLLRVQRMHGRAEISRFDPSAPLFSDHQILGALASAGEDNLFENLLLRGLLDA
jgi:predicted ATPase